MPQAGWRAWSCLPEVHMLLYGRRQIDQLGTTDDCGFSPFSDDEPTSRDTAFSKITARVQGTQLAYDQLK